MTHQKTVMGIFAYIDDLLKALKFMAENDFKVHTVYSPFPHHEIEEALHLKPSSVRFFTLCGGILGVMAGVGLVVYTCMQWKFIVSGKPIIPFVPAVVVGFEFCILLSVLFNFGGLLFRSRLPRLRRPEHYDDRFSQDHFGILIQCSETDLDRLSNILKEAGAEEIHEVDR